MQWAATEEAKAALHLRESCPLRKPSLRWALTIPSLLDTAGIWAATEPRRSLSGNQ